MIVKAKEITKEFFDFPSLRDLILGILQHIKSPTVAGSVFGLVLEPKILGTAQFLELLNLTLAHLVDGIVQIGNAVVQVMTVADRLLIHAHILVDTSLITLIQTSFNGTKHNAMYLIESKAEKTCSLCLIFGRGERFYRFFPSAKTSGSLVMPRGQRHS